ncbi:MAG: sugar ABC transporter permease [Planctomycetota bacterium]|nr:sugar ABC transporter permease [Planctomycetota bacterium]
MKPSRERRLGLLFISPFLIGFTVFTIYPVIASLYYSFCDYDVLSPPQFVGLANFREMASDDRFAKGLWNTVVFTVFAVPVTMVTALVLAFLLNMKLRGQALYRTIFFLPSIVPIIASSVLWLWLLNSDYGLINASLRPIMSWLNSAFGLHLEPPGWLTDPDYAKPALIMMAAWGVGGNMILYLAALGDVPQQLYEAAELDGAGAWERARHVTLPMISPVLFFTLVMGLIGSFQYFAQPLVMWPGGAPGDSALFYALYLFQNAFLYLRMGYASAQAWLLFIVIVATTLLVFRSTRRFVYYAGEGA